MIHYSYLALLLVSISGLVVLDWRHKIAFFENGQRTTLTIASGLILFIIWDLLGIHLGIFFSGHSRYSLGLMIVPNFPIEELFFLFLLCYITLLLYLTARQRWIPTL